jgi:hypothetical protein
MDVIQPLNLPKTNLNLTRNGNSLSVQCLIRKKKIILTPEEWVRQHYIAYLNITLGYKIERISVEKSLNYFGMNKRWDIVVYNKDYTPEILIECKATSISLNEKVLEQALIYQNKLGCKYIAITNGIAHAYWFVNQQIKDIQRIESLPNYKNESD